ncbi:hypothetical protein THAOC_14272 [Thalassiosira oceanica]|uniref:MYND-type domain-containing protein n=1 Tax=Thalassiosira oceanica TaxID=159749 RepID=K0SIY6_THAOC|nr:hypothetical protein THAOC_14272 [Thalassiosira oceanica]|mmetsp:Transcript_2642/g.5338  ORF Transcript_2642/g.5338 Transcript_2642/m.5338 type:complete len:574 (-) Transcript_2642:26-1747(-)|eukprot:EJK64939.1 hypothetical protein THAOC_14272 [Thalassiosira oceanica]
MSIGRQTRNKAVEKRNLMSHYRPHSRFDADRLNASRDSADRAVGQLEHLPYFEKRAAIRLLLSDIGVDVARDDADPVGDGDQRPITTVEGRDVARHLFATGGDIYECFNGGHVSTFAIACSSGQLGPVRRAIDEAARGASGPCSRNSAFQSMIEKRETSMRLSPLLMVVALSKNMTVVSTTSGPQFSKLAKLLLKRGASPVAKDVTGKTACHYGAGAMGTPTTVEIVGMCAEATRSHHLYSRDVELHGLNKAKMNGMVGVVGGYDVDTGRRSVYLSEENREVLVKLENLKLVEDNTSSVAPYPPLVNIKDKMGTVALQELVMPESFTGLTRPPGISDPAVTAAFLLKHGADIYLEDVDGVSPFRMVSGYGQLIGEHGVARVIMDHARHVGKEGTKARKRGELKCWNCDKDLSKDAPRCSKCNVARYCNRDCQVAHWKSHKAKCKELSASKQGVRLEHPSVMSDGLHRAAVSFRTGRMAESGSYAKPRGVGFDKKFVVKVQAAGETAPMMVYDETRQCQFDINWGQKGFGEILAAVRSEPAWQGRKTFMKASFGKDGVCTMFPDRAGVKSHYTW